MTDHVTLSMAPDEWERVRTQHAVVQQMVHDLYGATLDQSEADLDLLQRIVDDSVLAPSETYLLQCLGIAFGEVLANRTPLEWVVVSDEYGRDPALQSPGTSVLVFPLTMISKRIEEGRDVSVRALFSAICTDVERLSAGTPS